MTDKLLSESETIVFWLIGATEKLHRLGILSEPQHNVAPELWGVWDEVDRARSSLSISGVAGLAAEHVRACTNSEDDFLKIYHILMLYFNERTTLFRAYLEDTLENSPSAT